MTVSSERLLAHRGAWVKEKLPQNSPQALLAALQAGFGIETDLRDFNRKVVISHDPPTQYQTPFLDFLEQASLISRSEEVLLALNVKSDGLVSIFNEELDALKAFEHFFFDMSTPELVQLSRSGLNVGLRMSEFEELSSQLKIVMEPKALWIDGFDSEWWDMTNLPQTGDSRTDLVFVSPELHGRDPKKFWAEFAHGFRENPNWFLCTDYPWDVLEMMDNA